MSNVYKIVQGDTGPTWMIGIVGVSNLTGYTCKMAVKGQSISRSVTEVASSRFYVTLTPAETGGLPLGSHVVAIELANSILIPPFVRETHLDIQILEQIVPPAP
jgi:hypothetical protein